MKNNLGIKLAVLSMSLVLGFSVSCQKKTVAVETRSNPTAQQDRYGATTADTSQIGENTLGASVTGSASESNVVLQEDIFFEFDKATLTPEARETLTKTGAWLRVNADVVITIEGHCDERGTNEYNLALGDRRAESVKTFLTDLGVDRSRLTTVSYGEERPFVRGQDEASWAQNRRAHFLIR
jgi:peptidoglycan-associated lipoprotein